MYSQIERKQSCRWTQKLRVVLYSLEGLELLKEARQIPPLKTSEGAVS